ncbi:hypothetical protein [Mycoplasma sp. OR1901]|uniref:hypothetical protein n=1 Tax=Mycoplasma sp. OR1901 TaxID=2742195 RepID=UPI00158213E7|nr:hypothetical protein [Mycoplasma sp. OR1901]QKT05247.1 hypothetical protein HTZ87_00805 [Mycoplasma sp. OR1901]
MSKIKNKTTVLLSGVAAVASVATAVAVLWTWSSKNNEYELKYKILRELISKLSIEKEKFSSDFSKLEPNFRNKDQFVKLNKIKNDILDKLKESISKKEKSLSNNDSNLVFNREDEYKNNDNGFEINDYNKSLINAEEIKELMTQIQDPNIKDEYLKRIVKDLKSDFKSIFSNTNATKQSLLDYLNKQNEEIQKWKKLDKDLIDQLPLALQEKFTNKLNEAGDNIFALKELNKELLEYKRLSDLADKIDDVYTKGNILRDLNSSNLDELPEIEDKINKILEEESKSEFQKLKEQVIDLNSLVKDQNAHNNFEQEINVASQTESIDKLLETKKKIEEYLKENAGAEGFIKYKKESLTEKINNSNLDQNTKNKYLDKIKNAEDIQELNSLEKKINEAIDLKMNKDEAEKLIKLLNSPEKEKLLDELYDAKNSKQVEIVANKAAKILSKKKQIAKDKLKKLDGDFDTKNTFISRLTEAVKESEFIDIAAQIDLYIEELINKTQNEINKIDENPKKRDELQKRLDKAKNNPNTNAGILLDILNEAKALDNFEEYRKEAKEKAQKLNDKNQSKKFIDDLDGAKTLDEVIKLKEQVDTAYQFELDKAKAIEAIKRVQHEGKKAEFNVELGKATTSEELLKLTSKANKYADFETANKLKYLQLKDFIEKNVNDQTEKEKFNSRLENDLKDEQKQNNINQEQVNQKLDETSKALDRFITNQKHLLEAIKERILGKLALVKDQEKSEKLENERILLDNVKSAKELEKVVDDLLNFERTKDNIIEKVDNLLDKKDYIKALEEATNLDQLKAIEPLVDADLDREAKELKDAKDNANDKLTKILDSNENKNNWANRVSEAKDPKVVNAIIEEINKYLNDLKEEAREAIKKVAGDDQNYSNLDTKLSNADSEELLKEVKSKADELFSNKFENTNTSLENLSKDHPMWNQFNNEVKAANNIQELNDAKQKIDHAITVDQHKKEAKESLKEVQDKKIFDEILSKIEGANDVDTLVAIKDEISERIKNEKAEIKANIDAIKEEIQKLFTNDNIQKFNDIVANDQISLDDSRKALEAIKEAYKIEQDQLKDAKREALNELNKLEESTQKNEIRDRIEKAQNIINDITNAKQAIKDRIQTLKDQAIAATNKLNDKGDRVTAINNAQTQADIDKLKNLSITEFDNIKSQAEQLANNTLNIEESSVEKTNTLERINAANSENELNKIKDHINELLTNYKQKATDEASRLKPETVSENNVLSTDINPLTSQSEVKQRIDEVNKIIEDRISKAYEALGKLVGNDQEHAAKLAKLQELEAKKDVVTEKEITDLTALMDSIFNDEHKETNVELQKVTDPDQKVKLQEELTKANTIKKLSDLKKKIAVQLKKEQILKDLTSKITFEDQASEFRNKINEENTDSLDKLAKIEEEINKQSEYNKTLKQKTDEINAKLQKIDTDENLRNSLKQELDNARTDTQAEEVRTKINQKFEELRNEALEAIKGLEGSEEKSIQNNELSNADFESDFIKIKTNAENALQDKRNKVNSLNESTNTSEKEKFKQRIADAENIETLKQIEKEINNQATKEKIQSIINDLNTSTEKEGFVSRLGNVDVSSDDAKNTLDTLLQDVKDRAKTEGNDFKSSLQEAKDAVALLAVDNSEKNRLTAEIDRLEHTDKNNQVAADALKVRDEAFEIIKTKRADVKKLIEGIIKPTTTNGETATNQTEKYDALIAKVDAERTETDIQNVYEIEAQEYLKSIKDKYINSINSLFPEETGKQQLLETLNDTNNQNINSFNTALKEANEKLSTIIEDLNSKVESTEKKQQFQDKLDKIKSNNVEADNGSTTVNTDRWQTRLPDLKELYDLVKSQKEQEENTLRLYKEQLESKIDSKLSGEKQAEDSTPKNEKTTLIEELKSAKTLEQAKKISEKLHNSIEEKRKIAKASIDLAQGHENYNHLSTEIGKEEITEDKIKELQRQASEYVQEAKTNARVDIDKIEDTSAKNDLLTKLNETNNTVAKIKELELEAKIINKKADLNKKLNKLWEENKSNYQQRINDLSANEQSTLDGLLQIEQEIDNAQRKQDSDLAQAKEEANEVINRLNNGHENSANNKDTKLQEVVNATDLKQVNKAKEDAQAILTTEKNATTESLKKINVQDLPQNLEDSNSLKPIVDLYNELKASNTDLATEETYKTIQTKVDKSFNDYKEAIRRQITENASSKKDDLLRKIDDAQTIDDLHQLANANEVYKEADKITKKLEEHANNDNKTTFSNELKSIVDSVVPSTDKVKEGENLSKKQTDLNKLKELLNRVNEAVERQNEEIAHEKEKVNNALEAINGTDSASTTKKEELQRELEQAIKDKNVSAITVVKDKAKAYLDTKKQDALDLLNKLTVGKAPRATVGDQKGLQEKFNEATSQTDYENVKKEIEAKLNELKTKAEEANSKIGSELNDKLNEAKRVNDQKHYDDLINEANTKFEQYQNQARTKLREANLVDQKTFANDINTAENKAKLDEIQRKIQEQKELEIAKSEAEVEINKLKDPKKTDLLNQLNQDGVLKAKVDELKQQAIEHLNEKKRIAKEAATRFNKVDNDPNNKYNIKYGEATTEQDFETITNNANNEFENLVRNTKLNIERLRNGDNTQQKPTVAEVNTKKKASEVEALLKQALNYARDYAKKEIEKIPEEKRDALKRKLEAATSVDVINDITDQAKAIKSFEDAKNRARENANSKLEGHERLQDIIRQINEAQNDQQLTNATSQITPLLDTEANKLIAALRRLEDTNAIKTKHKDKNANNTSVQGLRNAVKEVEAELKKKEDAAKVDIEKIHLTNHQVQNESFVREWNRDYQNNNPKGVKNKFDEISADKYERDFKQLSSKVNVLLESKKDFVKEKIGALEAGDLKNRLNGLINDPNNKTYNKLAEIYKDVLTGKTEAQRLEKLREVERLIGKLKNYVPNQKSENYNNGLSTKSYAQLEEVKNRAQSTLQEELRIARERAIEEVKKLPSKVVSYNRASWLNQLRNSQNIDDIISIENQARTKNEKIISDLEAKINQMPEHARGDLNSQKTNIINAQRHDDNNTKGDKLLSLQSVAQNTVNKSRELESVINSTFPESANGNLENGGTQKYRDWLRDYNYNSNKADTIDKINQIIANTRELKQVYNGSKTLFDEGIINNVEARDGAKTDFRRALFNISTNSSAPSISNMTFDSIKNTLQNLNQQMIRNRDIFNYVGEAKRIANTLLEHQRINDWSENTLNRHKWQPNNAEIEIVKNKINSMNALKSKLDEINAKLENPSNFSGANSLKQALKEQWNRTNSLGEVNDDNNSGTANGLFNNISNNRDGLIKLIANVKEEIKGLTTANKKSDFTRRLNELTTRAQIDTLLNDIQKQKLIEEAKPYINRLSDSNKQAYNSQINESKSIETIRQKLLELKNYLTNEQNKAIRSIARLTEKRENTYLTHKRTAENNLANENQYSGVTQYVQSVIRSKDNQLKEITKHFDNATRNRYTTNIDTDNENSYDEKISDSRRLLDKYNEVKRLITNRFNSNSTLNLKTEYQNLLEADNKQFDKLSKLKQDIDNKYNEFKNNIKNNRIWNSTISRNKKADFERRWNTLKSNNNTTFDQLITLKDEIDNYNEIDQSTKRRNSNTNYQEFMLNSNAGINSATVDVRFYNIEKLRNKKLYAVAVDKNNHTVVSNVRNGNRNTGDSQNTLSFVFVKSKVKNPGEYTIKKIVVSDRDLTDQQVKDQTRNLINRKEGTNDNNYEAFTARKDLLVSAGRNIRVKEGFNGPNRYIEISGFKLEEGWNTTDLSILSTKLEIGFKNGKNNNTIEREVSGLDNLIIVNKNNNLTFKVYVNDHINNKTIWNYSKYRIKSIKFYVRNNYNKHETINYEYNINKKTSDPYYKPLDYTNYSINNDGWIEIGRR